MSYTIQELKVGQSDSFSKTITETDVYLFAGITGDLNPAQVDAECYKNNIWKTDRTSVLGPKLPEPGSIYLSQQINFLAPVYFGDTITAVCRIRTSSCMI